MESAQGHPLDGVAKIVVTGAGIIKPDEFVNGEIYSTPRGGISGLDIIPCSLMNRPHLVSTLFTF